MPRMPRRASSIRADCLSAAPLLVVGLLPVVALALVLVVVQRRAPRRPTCCPESPGSGSKQARPLPQSLRRPSLVGTEGRLHRIQGLWPSPMSGTSTANAGAA
eukprot:5575982-Alexandrium_andersonii.AAC.1